jgi:trehalose-6-phosphate synthase
MLVNPYDVEQMADTILNAFRMNQAERGARMKRMRKNVLNENVFWWVDSFLRAGKKVVGRSAQLSKRRYTSTKKTPNTERPMRNAQRI